MRSKVIAATVAIALALGWMVWIKSGDLSPPPSEPSTPAIPTSVQRVASLRAPTPWPATTGSATNPPVATNLYARLVNGDIPKVTREQLETYLAQNRRSADALLGALRASGDDALLAEAKEKFPNDPRVQFAAAFRADSPEERRQWLEKFKQSAPDNALPNYLSASELFKSGQPDQALQELKVATDKPAMENYLLDFIQNAEEAYRAGGYSEAEAKAFAGTGALLPELAQLKRTGVELADLAKKYQQAGDEGSAQAVLQMGLNLGHRLDQSPQVTLVQELVGIAIERLALNAMNPNSPYGETGQTVQNQLDALTARRNGCKDLTSQSEPILMSLSDQDLGHYFDRIKLYGDAPALRWVMNKGQ